MKKLFLTILLLLIPSVAFIFIPEGILLYVVIWYAGWTLGIMVGFWHDEVFNPMVVGIMELIGFFKKRD